MEFKKEICQEIKKEYSLYLNEDYDVSHIEALWDLGYLPIKVKIIPEGEFVPYGVPVLTIVNTEPEFFWLTNFLETMISNMLWMPMTAATTAYAYKKILTKACLETNPESIEMVAQELIQNKIIGFCNGFGEAGPRALGNRSILALANSKKLSKKLSMEKKGREWYRPLAPISLEKNTKYFTGLKNIHLLSKFMLLDFDVLPEKQKEIQGAIHADGTARFQTIFKRDDNPFMYDLLTYLDEHFGVKSLINTSYNGGGEPIVHTETDALNSAKKMSLDAVILNGKLQ